MIHLVTLTHKHGEDVIVLAEAPTTTEVREIETWYSKVHDIDVYAQYYQEMSLKSIQDPKAYIRRLKGMYECLHKGAPHVG